MIPLPRISSSISFRRKGDVPGNSSRLGTFAKHLRSGLEDPLAMPLYSRLVGLPVSYEPLLVFGYVGSTFGVRHE